MQLQTPVFAYLLRTFPPLLGLAAAFWLFLPTGLASTALAQAAQNTEALPLDLTDEERAWLLEHPVIRLGADPAYPPFEFFDSEGIYKGIATDYLRIIGQRTGISFVGPVQQPWNETLQQARSKKIDLLAALNPSQERKSYLIFSDPYLSYRRMILMRDDAPAITGLTDLAGKRVGVLRGTTDAIFLSQNAPDVRVVEFTRGDNVLLAISSGEIAAGVGNGLSGIFIARQLGLLNIKVAAPASLDTHSIHFAVRDDWPELASIINKALATIPVSERNDIQRRWSLVQMETDYSLVWKTMLAILPFFLLVFVWAWHAKSQQKRLEEAQERLQEATREAQAANKAKSTFLANMSHEMRTPLTGIIGFLGLIQDAKPKGDIRDNVELSLASAYDLLNLINDLLDLARLESGATQVDEQAVDIGHLVRSVKSAMTPLAQDKGLALTIAEEGTIPAFIGSDPKLLRQILINLVGNAIKFTEQGQVTIELIGKAGHPGDPISIHFNVHDTGIGIRDEDKARLLRRFEQVHSLAENGASGTGLGLAICQELVTLLGGEFSFDSTYGRGSTFSAVIPCYEANEPANNASTENEYQATTQQQSNTLKGAKVYLADDNRIISALVEKMLTRHGVDLTQFANGKQLLERLRQDADSNKGPSCELILMDIHMPEMNGVDAQKAIRRLGPAFATIPIIALTANAIQGERENYLRQGMDCYISKPIDADLLRATIADFLRGRNQTPPISEQGETERLNERPPH